MPDLIQQILFIILPAFAIGIVACLWGYNFFATKRKLVGFVVGAFFAALVAAGIIGLFNTYHLPGWLVSMKGLLLIILAFFICLLGMYSALLSDKVFAALAAFITGVLNAFLILTLAYSIRYTETNLSLEIVNTNWRLYLIGCVVVGIVFAVFHCSSRAAR